jgi:hypothetical protein
MHKLSPTETTTSNRIGHGNIYWTHHGCWSIRPHISFVHIYIYSENQTFRAIFVRNPKHTTWSAFPWIELTLA